MQIIDAPELDERLCDAIQSQITKRQPYYSPIRLTELTTDIIAAIASAGFIIARKEP